MSSRYKGMACARPGRLLPGPWSLIGVSAVVSRVKRDFACTLTVALPPEPGLPASTIALEAGGAATDTQQAIPGSSLFRVRSPPSLGPSTSASPCCLTRKEESFRLSWRIMFRCFSSSCTMCTPAVGPSEMTNANMLPSRMPGATKAPANGFPSRIRRITRKSGCSFLRSHRKDPVIVSLSSLTRSSTTKCTSSDETSSVWVFGHSAVTARVRE